MWGPVFSGVSLIVHKVTRNQAGQRPADTNVVNPARESTMKLANRNIRNHTLLQPARAARRLGHLNPLPRKDACMTRLPNHYKPFDNYRLGNINTPMQQPNRNKYAPQGFARHPPKPYYIGNKDNDGPDISLHAHDEFFDDDSDTAFTPKQISIS